MKIIQELKLEKFRIDDQKAFADFTFVLCKYLLGEDFAFRRSSTRKE